MHLGKKLGMLGIFWETLGGDGSEKWGIELKHGGTDVGFIWIGRFDRASNLKKKLITRFLAEKSFFLKLIFVTYYGKICIVIVRWWVKPSSNIVWFIP
jgi:hypothetical protein